MRLFQAYRSFPWNPDIVTVDSLDNAVSLIAPDGDIDLVDNIKSAIELGEAELQDLEIEEDDGIVVPARHLKSIHNHVFPNQGWITQFRGVPVIHNHHMTPDHDIVNTLLDVMEKNSRIYDLDNLEDWYWDFSTVHPFRQNNSIVGTIVVSVISNFLCDTYLVALEEGVDYE